MRNIIYLGFKMVDKDAREHIGVYNFSNIRFAAAPVGDLRFAPPASPKVNRSLVQTGSEARICPQDLPSWMPQSMSNAISYVLNGSITSMGPILMDPRASEDCLFLDVVVPKKIFETSGKKMKGAPVLVWIDGGGYTGGSKSGQWSGSPIGLLRRGDNGFVYLAINYRIGAFGWLSGSYVQRTAQQTLVFIISFLTVPNAYGGSNGTVSFQQAILQSPVFTPDQILNPDQQERIFHEFLEFADVSTLEGARHLPSSVLMEANRQQVYNFPLGSFTYGPVVDGIFVPEAPSRLLSQRKLDTTPNDTAYVSTQLYPPVFNGSRRYTDEISRAGATFQEVIIQCNDIMLAMAFGNATFNYVFDIFPGLHAQDISATFDVNLNPTPGTFDPLIALQQIITSFTLTGEPATDLVRHIPIYGPENRLLVLNATGISTSREDPRVVERCEEWNKLLHAA
ncbi:Alpha/Beta hydrolase protein [Aspergillus oleicola]